MKPFLGNKTSIFEKYGVFKVKLFYICVMISVFFRAYKSQGKWSNVTDHLFQPKVARIMAKSMRPGIVSNPKTAAIPVPVIRTILLSVLKWPVFRLTKVSRG